MEEKTFAELGLTASPFDTEEKIFTSTEKIMRDWMPQSEVRWQTYGKLAAAAVTSTSGIFINYLFRRQMKLRGMGVIIPVVAIGGVIPCWFYTKYPKYILKDLYVWENNCSLCLQTKAALIHSGISVIYPLLVSSVLNMTSVHDMGFDGDFLRGFKESLKFLGSNIKPLLPKLLLLCAANGIFGAALFTQQAIEVHSIHMMIKEAGDMMREEQLMEQRAKAAQTL